MTWLIVAMACFGLGLLSLVTIEDFEKTEQLGRIVRMLCWFFAGVFAVLGTVSFFMH